MCGICRPPGAMSCRATLVIAVKARAKLEFAFLVGRCSASSAARFPRTSLTVRGFAGAGGVVDFGAKRAAGGTFGCSACDVCFMRAKFSLQNLMKPRHTLPASPRLRQVAREHVLRLLGKQCQRAGH